jgi:phage gpG-like protein
VKELAERLRRLAEALGDVDVAAVSEAVLTETGAALQAQVTAALSRRPGESHDAPWERDGTLRGSIGFDVADGALTVGSTDPVAVFQEFGTRTVQPRPFLAPAGAKAGAPAAEAIGDALRDKLAEAVT